MKALRVERELTARDLESLLECFIPSLLVFSLIPIPVSSQPQPCTPLSEVSVILAGEPLRCCAANPTLLDSWDCETCVFCICFSYLFQWVRKSGKCSAISIPRAYVCHYAYLGLNLPTSHVCTGKQVLYFGDLKTPCLLALPRALFSFHLKGCHTVLCSVDWLTFQSVLASG